MKIIQTPSPTFPRETARKVFTALRQVFILLVFLVSLISPGAAAPVRAAASFAPNENQPPVINQGDFVDVTMSEDSDPDPFSLTLTATDADGDTLTWSISTPAQHGTAEASGDGLSKVITYTPDPDYDKTDSFVVQVTDGNGGTDTITVTVTIAPINDAPVIINQYPLHTNEDIPLKIEPDDLIVTDVDNTYPKGFNLSIDEGEHYTVDGFYVVPEQDYFGNLTVPVRVNDGAADSQVYNLGVVVLPVNDKPIINGQVPLPLTTPEDTPLLILPEHLDVTDVDNEYPFKFTLYVGPGENYSVNYHTITPDLDYTGILTVPVQLFDPGGAHSAIFNLIVEVRPVNDVPNITGQKTLSTPEDTPLTITLDDLTVTDSDNDYPDDFSLLLQNGANYTREGNTLTPALDFNGNLTVPVRVNDGTSTSPIFNLAVEVSPVNDDPVITEGESISVSMSKNGTPTPFDLTLHATDVDGDNLTWSIKTNATNGAATVSGTGVSKAISYVPNTNYVGSDSFVVQVSDGKSGTDTIVVNVTILAPNVPPVITEGASTTVTMSEDSDPNPFILTLHATDENDGDTLTWSISTQPTKGVASASGTGTSKVISYNPQLNYNGTDSFVVQVSDGKGGVDTIAVDVTINPVNDAPVITDQKTLTTPEDISLTVTLNDLTVTDVDNTYPTGFSLSLQGGTNYIFSGATITPAPNFYGTLKVPVTVSDGSASSEVFELTVTVTPVNDAPKITGQKTVTTPEETSRTITLADLTVTDVDNPDQSGFSLTLQSGPNYTLAGSTITPVLNFNGNLTVPLTVSDGTDSSEVYDLTVTVTPVNDAPVITQGPSINVSMTKNGTPTAFDLTLNATDVDAGTTLTWSISQPAEHGAATASGTGESKVIGYVPNTDYVGSDSFVVQVSDGDGGTDTITVNVNVQASNASPVITQGASTHVTMSEDGDPDAFELTLNATDADGNTLTWSITNQATYGTATASGTGASKAIGYTPTKDYHGSDNFVVQVSDGIGGVDSITVNVTILPVNDAPVITGQKPLSTLEDTPLTINLSDLNVTDPDNTYPIGFSLSINSGDHYTVVGATITPAKDFNGSLTVLVQVSDGTDMSALYNLTVTVTPVNDAPVIVEGAAVNVSMSKNGTPDPFDLTLHASDADVGDTLTWSIASPASHGTAGAAGTGASKVITYVPAADYVGADSFVVQVDDGNGGTATIQVNVAVGATNSAPVITEGELTNVSMSEDGAPNPFSLTLHATDADASDTLTWSVVTPAAHGVAAASGTGAALPVAYTPAANYHGADSFVVQVSDGNGGTDTATVNVVIVPVNDDPEITEGAAITVTMSQDGASLPFSLTLHATDVDAGDTLTWTVSQTATHGAASVAGTGAVGYVPEAGYSGTDSFEVQVSDGSGGTDTILVNVIITAATQEEPKLYIPVVQKAE